MELNRIYNEDCLEGIAKLDDRSIDLVLTDPPYWHHKSPGKPYSQRRQSNTSSKFATSELYSVDGGMMSSMSDFDDRHIYALLDALKPKMKIFNGYFFCSEAQVPYYALWAEENRLMFSILVWEKPVSIINKNRFSQNLEYIVRVYDYGTALNRLEMSEWYNRVCHDVVVGGSSKIHPTQKPESIMRRFIRLSSKKGDVVLDPFVGSGTTAVSCMKEGRQYIGFELDEGFYAKACERIAEVYAEPVIFGCESCE